MSTLQTVSSALGGQSRTVTPARWRDLIGAEWIKIRALRSIPVVLAGAVGTAWYFSYAMSKQTAGMWPSTDPALRSHYNAAHDALFPPMFFILMTVVGTIGAQSMFSEHASGLIRTSLIAVPDRSRLLLAKAFVVLGVLTVVGVITSIGAWTIALAEYSGRVAGFGWHTPGLLQVFVATVLVFPLSGMIGMAFGTVIRHPVITIFALFLNFWIVPVGIASVDSVLGGRLFGHIANVQPGNAWLILTTTVPATNIVGGHPSNSEGWISYAAWFVGALVIAVAALRQRDV